MGSCYVCVPLECASTIGNTRVPLERVSIIGNTVQPNQWRGSGLAKINCWSHCRCWYWSHAQWLAGALAKAKRWDWMKTSQAKQRWDLDHKLDRRERTLHCNYRTCTPGRISWGSSYCRGNSYVLVRGSIIRRWVIHESWHQKCVRGL